MNYAIITENDESNWDDVKGIQYHFPSKYLKIIPEGTKVIYYKGKLRNKNYENERISKEAHYFALAEIGIVTLDQESKTFIATINNYTPFNIPIPIKNDQNKYYEPEADEFKALGKNYFWQNAVRKLTEENYNTIIRSTVLNLSKNLKTSNSDEDDSLTSTYKEGKKVLVYTTKYERNSKAREDAIKIHGLTCMICGLNFENKYGELGKGFIHVHHNKPLSTTKKESDINPKTDLDIVCPNCHAMIHRNKKRIHTIEEIKFIYRR